MTNETEDWHDKDEYSDEELAEFRQLLLDERERVMARLRMRVSEAVGDTQAMPDESDQAQQLTEQAYMLRLADKEQKLLKLIDKALKKFAEDEYGFCEGTGDLINPARLRLRPWTRYSIEYKEEQERIKKGFATKRNNNTVLRGDKLAKTDDDHQSRISHIKLDGLDKSTDEGLIDE